MLEFLAVNFNLPTLLVAALVFGGTAWLLYRTRKAGGGCGGCPGGCPHCTGGCHSCGHCTHEKTPG